MTAVIFSLLFTFSVPKIDYFYEEPKSFKMSMPQDREQQKIRKHARYPRK